MTAYSPIAQLVEQRTVNPCVPGSSPGWRAIYEKPSSLFDEGFFIVAVFILTAHNIHMAAVFFLAFLLYGKISFDWVRFCLSVSLLLTKSNGLL